MKINHRLMPFSGLYVLPLHFHICENHLNLSVFARIFPKINSCRNQQFFLFAAHLRLSWAYFRQKKKYFPEIRQNFVSSKQFVHICENKILVSTLLKEADNSCVIFFKSQNAKTLGICYGALQATTKTLQFSFLRDLEFFKCRLWKTYCKIKFY